MRLPWGIQPKITFDKDQTGEYQDVEFVGPGHPFFEGIVERVLKEYGPALLRGATFYNAEDMTFPMTQFTVATPG
jgi:hypothetical protein